MDIHDQVLSAFQAEHRELLDVIRTLLQQQASSGAPLDRAALDEAFRMAHSFKGGARICNLHHMETLGHHLETLFERVRRGALELDEHVSGIVMHVLDSVEDWMGELAQGREADAPADVIGEIESVLEVVDEPSCSPAPTCPGPAPPAAAADCSVQASVSEVDSTTPTVIARADDDGVRRDEFVRVHAGALDELLETAVHLAGESSRLEAIEREARVLLRDLDVVGQEWSAARQSCFAGLQQMRSQRDMRTLVQFLDGFDAELRALQRSAEELCIRQRSADWTLRSLGDRLRARALGARTIEAVGLCQGFRKMVRDLAHEAGCEAELTIIGGEQRVDRAVLQALKHSLMHLLRNAVAHGIEPAEERAAVGKPTRGTIRLTFRSAGNRLIVRVEDDGRGLNGERIAEAARRLHLHRDDAPVDGIAAAPERLIFHPGLTTSEHVDAMAGRGIGLADVDETVRRLQGDVSVQSKPGAGTRFEIRVPLSIASHRLLFVRSDEGVFAIPVSDIEQLMSATAQRMETIEGWPVVKTNNGPVRVTPLWQILGAPPAEHHGDQPLAIAIVRTGEGRMAIAAREFVAEGQALIKELHGPLRDVEIYHGAVVLDDGSLALVLRPAALRSNGMVKGAPESAPLTLAAQERTPVTVLVVDDSFTTRTLEKSLLESHGYIVRIAVDGVEALAQLQRDPIDLVITDVEMPRMDGFSLLERIRSTPRFARLPVVIVTSVKQQSQQQRGLELGADAYVVKQRFDHEELLRTIEQLV